jgi:hypothetical protein
VLSRRFDDLDAVAEFGALDDFGQEVFSLQLSPCFGGTTSLNTINLAVVGESAPSVRTVR